MSFFNKFFYYTAIIVGWLVILCFGLIHALSPEKMNIKIVAEGLNGLILITAVAPLFKDSK